MKPGQRYLSFLFLTAALAAPAATITSAASQDDRRQEDNHRNDKRRTRVYDRSHKDYHVWDDNEDRAYRRYLGEQRQDYREYSRLKRTEQNRYWDWRHSHPDDGRDHN
jgi:hypothetical protein